MTDDFELHPGLAGDSILIAKLDLCDVRLMKDANYPWLLLVPRARGLVELVDLDGADQARLMAEIARVSEALRQTTGCHKLNVAMLGNQVPQLHVHVIGRFESDTAWPRPVWGVAPAVAYDTHVKDELVERFLQNLEESP